MSTSETSNAKPNPSNEQWLRVLGIVYGVLVLPGGGFAITAVFAFDAPGSENSPLTELFAYSLFILPLTLLACSVGCIVCSGSTRSAGKLWSGRLFALAPVLNVAVAITAIVLIQTLCNGQFVCQL